MRLLRSALLASTVVLAACSTPIGTTGPAPAMQALPGNAPYTAGKTEVLWLGQASTRIRTPIPAAGSGVRRRQRS